MNQHRRPSFGGSPTPPAPQTGILFCAICQESIPSSELRTGPAQVTPRGRVFCGVCATSSPAERIARREALAAEFADDAPVPVPAPIRVEPAPVSRSDQIAVLELRVGELERAAFRLQSRVATLEERLEEAMKRAT